MIRLVALLWLLATPVQAAIGFGANGLSSLTWSNSNFILTGLPSWPSTFGMGQTQGVDGAVGKVQSTGGAWVHDTNTFTSVFTNSVVGISIQYADWTNGMEIRISVTNRSSATLLGWTIPLLEANFPAVPDGWTGVSSPTAHSIESPLMLTNHWATGTSVVTITNVNRSVLAHWWAGTSTVSTQKMLIVTTIPSGGYGDQSAVYGLSNQLIYPFAPGNRDSVTLRWLFTSSGSPDTIMAPIFAFWSNAIPFNVAWTNRSGPIMSVFLSQVADRTPTNPRGWSIVNGSPDFISSTGRLFFSNSVRIVATNAAAEATRTHCQGIIVWDIEGEEFGNIAYSGQPYDLPLEMQLVADGLFSVLTNAGHRVGVTIRPQKATRNIYTFEGAQSFPLDIVANLTNKMAYANTRWGCQMFYIDSNVITGGTTTPPYALWRQAQTTVPNFLMIPEAETVMLHTFSIPYRFIPDEPATPGWIRAINSHAASFINIGGTSPTPYHAALVAAVQAGDILNINASSNAINNEVIQIYQEAFP